MPQASVLWQFFGVAVLLALTPGPDNLFVLLQSARLGQSGLEAKFRSRIEGFGRSLERPLGA